MRGDQESEMASSAGCMVFDAQLEAYLEGENRPQVSLHASECPFCGGVLADLEKIRQMSGEVGVREAFEVEPPETMWPSLRTSLISEGVIHQPESFGSRWFGGWRILQRPIPAAATAVVAIVCAVLLSTPGGPIHWPLTHRAQVGGTISPTPLALVESNPQLQGTVDQMERRFKAKVASFDPSLRDAYVKSLASLDGEILECQRNAQVQPRNPLTLQYLSSAYAQKAEVLQSALETPAP
ncbi:MAG: hypothetical protein ACRD3T_03175 [Terriglobia bacterium]